MNNRIVSTADPHRVRRLLRVTGVVQGVGFRPFVYGLAQTNQIAGFVGNDSSGVFIEIEGSEAHCDAFCQTLADQPPPLAHIESITIQELAPQGDTSFQIVPSHKKSSANTLISPDICICADCLAELFNPLDRRYRYPFINCTNCGPRFTIIQDIPYDRPLTTMAHFPMCADCQAEYENPLNRRFHAQPNACPQCGPSIWFENSATFTTDLSRLVKDEALAAAQSMLKNGRIVAVKGLGGFHLACDATNDTAVARLRERKGRVDKPFAIMARDVDVIRPLVNMTLAEEKLLTSKERPIVLLQKKSQTALSNLVAPGNNYLGVMLPYTPLHYLLLSDAQQTRQSCPLLVMTSGNFANEPIVKDNQAAREHLARLADALLFHDRDIYAHCDDSVLRIFANQEYPVRRSRGYAPFPVKLPFELPPTLAVGGELKATFCLAKGRHAFMSQHIGDMENLETLEAFDHAVDHFQRLFRIQPEIIVSDMHPAYLSTRWAAQHAGKAQLVKVQHHHAHIAALMAEHQLDGSEALIGFSFDGTGYGTDGAIWGGEVLIADYHGFERAYHLKYVPLPGGDTAVKRPYRTALAHLWSAGITWEDDLACVRACTAVEQNIILRQLETGLNAVPTSSMGRLFDAVAALANVRQTVTYEAQAAIEMETLARPLAGQIQEGYTFAITANIFDAAPLIQAVVADLRTGVSSAAIAAKFHDALARLILQISQKIRIETGLNLVGLSGGVFQNAALLEQAVALLQAAGFSVLTHALVPPNDGGLALGQAIIGSNSNSDLIRR